MSSRAAMRFFNAEARRRLFFGFCALLAGCGDEGIGTSVSGTVMYGGAPLTNAAIYFFPANGGRPVVAKVDEGGQYSIDVEPGEYRVTIDKIETAPPGWKEGDPLPPVKTLLPAQYTEQAKTVLSATVAEDQDEPINFELK